MMESIGAICALIAVCLVIADKRNEFIPWFLAFAFVAFGTAAAMAHDHPKQDAPIHEKFYKNWMMPDAPHISCCHERDCYPTEARKTPAGWEAKRREDGQWLRIPDSKIERNRDNPDGRNHLCAPPPDGDRVYCFTIGSGT